MNYIDEAKAELSKHLNIGKGLTNYYALLVLVKGEETTLKDVHDAWAVNINDRWDRDSYGEHHSLIPFNNLSPETQEKDLQFVEAIHLTAKALKERAKMNEKRSLATLKTIRQDIEQDVKDMEGKPFTGQEVAKNFGYVRAQLDALARIMQEMLEDEDGKVQ